VADKRISIVSPAGNDSFGDRRVNACWGSPLNYLALKKVGGQGRARNVLVVESVGRDGKAVVILNVGGHLAALENT
jgi:hypothetical protein